MIDDKLIDSLKKKLETCDSIDNLYLIRSQFLGKKSFIVQKQKQLSKLDDNKRREYGITINNSKQKIAVLIKKKELDLKIQKLNTNTNPVDITLSGKNSSIGNIHPISQTIEKIQNIFSKWGFNIATGPEIEDDYHNFTALNIPKNHPARDMFDTFYLDKGMLLRTHTSPVQIRVMKENKPPIKIIAPGRVYRRDSDVTHTPMFHQIEGLMINETTNFSELKWLMINFLQTFFDNKKLKIRFRPSYFPFTEPSAEVDIECFKCYGLKSYSCNICKNTGWLEVLGCGIVNKQVLIFSDIDHKKYIGLAFGMGIERLAMLVYGIDDLRLFFENNINFLKQF